MVENNKFSKEKRKMDIEIKCIEADFSNTSIYPHIQKELEGLDIAVLGITYAFQYYTFWVTMKQIENSFQILNLKTKWFLFYLNNFLFSIFYEEFLIHLFKKKLKFSISTTLS